MGLDPRLVNVAIEELPAMIAWIREAFHNKHPDAPVPSSAEVIAANQQAYESDLAKDDAYLNTHLN
jgi:hypothetical protein